MDRLNWKKNTALFLTGQALSLFGTMVVQYAILWYIVLKSQSGSMMTVVTIVAMLPMFFISPFAGVWADRYNRKYIINISDGTIAFFSLLVAIFFIFGKDSYTILLVCAFIRSLGQGIQSPAVMAFIPDIVPPEHLTRINGFSTSIQSFIALTSPMLGAALMTFAPLHTLFFLDVVTAAIGISIVFFFVKVPKKETQETQIVEQKGTSYFRELKEGLEYLKEHGFILRMVVFTAISMFLYTPPSFLTPLQVTRNFGADVWRLSAIEIAFSAGMLLGGILIGMWGGFKNRIYTMVFGIVVSGLLAVGLGVMPVFWLYLAIMAFAGVTVPLINTPALVILQTSVESAFMGRVMSVFTMASSVMMPIGMLVFGPLADAVSIDIILVVTGIFTVLLSIPMMSSKTLRKAGESHLQNEN